MVTRTKAKNAESVFEFSGNTVYEDFIASKMKVYAVIRAFEIIGEASKMVSDEVRVKYPLIEWQLMTDFRNLLIHEYFGIDYEKLWNVIHNELPYNYQMLKLIKL